MHIEGAQSVLSERSRDMTLVWNHGLKMYGLVMGFHVEYIHPDTLRDMNEEEFITHVSQKVDRYVESLEGKQDQFFMN